MPPGAKNKQQRGSFPTPLRSSSQGAPWRAQLCRNQPGEGMRCAHRDFGRYEEDGEIISRPGEAAKEAAMVRREVWL